MATFAVCCVSQLLARAAPDAYTNRVCAEGLHFSAFHLLQWKNNFSEIKWGVRIPLHEKGGEQEDAYTETGNQRGNDEQGKMKNAY